MGENIQSKKALRKPLAEIQEKREEMMRAAARVYGSKQVIVHVMERDPTHNLFHPKFLRHKGEEVLAYFCTAEAMHFRIEPVSSYMHSDVQRDSERFQKALDDAVYGVLTWHWHNPDLESPEAKSLREILADDRVFKSLDELKALVREKKIDHIINDLYMQPSDEKTGLVKTLMPHVKENNFAQYILVEPEESPASEK